MNPYLMLVLEALLFALAFGGLTWLRGEGLPARFAWEVIGVTIVGLGLSWLTGIAIHPVLFLAVIYVFTMRARLLVDLSNVLLARGWHERALSVLGLALRLASDALSQTIVRINVGVALIRQQRFEEAAGLLADVLAKMPHARGAPKYEAACRYNLGVAYLRLGQDARAKQQFGEVLQLLPNSLYARGAEAALRRHSQQR